MPLYPAQYGNWTRRHLLLALAYNPQLAAQNRTERVRYADPATEFEVFRLTDPSFSSSLPPTGNRIFSRRGNSLLYLSDRSGSLQAYWIDLKSWQSRLITQASALDPRCVTLTPDDRSLCYVDGNRLMLCPADGGSARQVYQLSSVSAEAAGLHVIPDGPSALVVEGGGKVRSAPLYKGSPRTLAENAEGVLEPLPRPRRASVLYRTLKGGIWLAHLDGSRNQKLKTQGFGAEARWSPDGRVVYYLHVPDDSTKSRMLREHVPDTGEDRAVAPTSQYASFSANSDASVFVGASESKAQPHVLLLLRSVRRELTLCEHKASNAKMASPVFSPDSQKIFFQSDRHGKPAIYMMVVDRLVEKTEEEATGER